MKKLLTAAVVVAMSVMFVGCGGKPKIPANTVAAAYVDLDKLVWNAADVVEDVIDELPKEMREDAEKTFKDFMKEHKDDIKAIDPEWACLTVGLDKKTGRQEVAVVIKCDYEKKLPSVDSSLEDALKAMAGEGKDKVEGCDVCAIGGGMMSFLPGKFSVGFVDKKYLVCAIVATDEDKKFFERMIVLYKDGKGETTNDFDDLTDLGGDTVARIQTAEVDTLIDILGVREDVKKFAEDCGDDDLVDLFTDFSNITLDVNFSDDIVGFELAVDAGSRKLAKLVEGAFEIVAFGGRVATALGVGFNDLVRMECGKEAAGCVKAAADLLRDCLEADRSGSVATLTLEIDTDDLIEVLVPELTK